MKAPDSTTRTLIVGETGSGKTRFAVSEVLSRANFDKMPWLIIDYKQEDPLINKIVDDFRVPEIDLSKKPPSKPGLYVCYPRPQIDDELMDKFLWQVVEKGRFGLYMDEGFTVPQTRKSAFSTIFTQGRAKHIPVIVLYQRPRLMNLFAPTQASFISIFPVGTEADQEAIMEYIRPCVLPGGRILTAKNMEVILPDYYSLWYDKSARKTSVLRPAPSEQEVLERFAARLRKGRDFI